ncbi:GntR family transcriptional regulator [Paeniglutamicibacter antarcticus]|uniref:GntR family transcriptional regulator n=1 Tax=Arthrobacter terrae TaxID=2935737 RepID=A0A931CME3_9MICC|nr:GntR family transcriptional regulator [Arthrobacter terrae]
MANIKSKGHITTSVRQDRTVLPSLSEGTLREQPLRETVRDQIRQRIYNGRYAPGIRLIERDLAAEFDVSRLPVREALRMLREEGLVTERPTRGLVVRELTRADVEELFDVREALEGMSCRLAAQRATDMDLSALKQILDQAKEATARKDVGAAREANGKFHDEIPRLAHNELLRNILEPLHGRLQWLFRQTDDLELLCSEHEQLLDAIASGDADLAARVAEQHVRSSRHRTLHALFQRAQ